MKAFKEDFPRCHLQTIQRKPQVGMTQTFILSSSPVSWYSILGTHLSRCSHSIPHCFWISSMLSSSMKLKIIASLIFSTGTSSSLDKTQEFLPPCHPTLLWYVWPVTDNKYAVELVLVTNLLQIQTNHIQSYFRNRGQDCLEQGLSNTVACR